MNHELVDDLKNRLTHQESSIHIDPDFTHLEKPERCPDWASQLYISTSKQRIKVPFLKIRILEIPEERCMCHIYVSFSYAFINNYHETIKHLMSDLESLELQYGMSSGHPMRLNEESIPVKIITFKNPLLIALIYAADTEQTASVNVAFQYRHADTTIKDN